MVAASQKSHVVVEFAPADLHTLKRIANALEGLQVSVDKGVLDRQSITEVLRNDSLPIEEDVTGHVPTPQPCYIMDSGQGVMHRGGCGDCRPINGVWVGRG